MARKLSGMDIIEAKQIRQSIEDAVKHGDLDEKDPEYLERMEIALEMMNPDGGEFEHMFKDENKLIGTNGKPVDVKHSKWSQVFYTIINWKAYKDKFEKRKRDRQREMNLKRKTNNLQEAYRNEEQARQRMSIKYGDQNEKYLSAKYAQIQEGIVKIKQDT